MNYIISCVMSFLLTAAITPVIIRLARSCKCLDIPGERRLHKRITPRWGGLAFFAGVLPFVLVGNSDSSLTAYIVASFLLVAMGMVDDYKSLPWKTKFTVMTVAASIVVFGGNVTVHHLGAYGSLGQVNLGIFSIPFTLISIIGITNAINLLDGLDGLAGGVSLLSFLFMGIAALLAGNLLVAALCFVFVGALAAFLLYNFPRARIFMGDTGSLFLGFSLAVTAIMLTQNANSAIDSMFPALILLIPIFDTLRVLVVRLLNGKNPFKADNLHLHYLLLQNNISPLAATLLLWSLTALFGGIALSMINSTSMSYLSIVLSASLFLSLAAIGLTHRQQSREPFISNLRRTFGMDAGSVGLPRYYIQGSGFTKWGEARILTLMVILGIVLLAAQAIAD